MDANDDFRTFGEKLAVDPANPDVVYAGTPRAGLFVSSDGGRAWQPVAAVPVGAKAATLNVLSVEPAGIGYLTVYPCDKPQPTASSLNMTNVNVANELSAPLSAAGTVCIFTSIPTHLIVDVAGAFLG